MQTPSRSVSRPFPSVRRAARVRRGITVGVDVDVRARGRRRRGDPPCARASVGGLRSGPFGVGAGRRPGRRPCGSVAGSGTPDPGPVPCPVRGPVAWGRARLAAPALGPLRRRSRVWCGPEPGRGRAGVGSGARPWPVPALASAGLRGRPASEPRRRSPSAENMSLALVLLPDGI
ncbi:protein of unknown function (plasmid) [Streptantibioticus cattleyicolor NRRL 8057 = DSM 46488]|nr:protein of unknown function [Streptantibioticus cattleyicolor NRRL 8057 = DSM 46488]